MMHYTYKFYTIEPISLFVILFYFGPLLGMLARNICLYVRLMLWLLECEKHMSICKNLFTSLKSGFSVFYVETIKA